MLDHLFEILKLCALERVEEHELEPEPKERNVAVSNLTERIWFTVIYEDTDSNKQQAAIIRQEILMLFAWYEEIMKENKRSVTLQIVVSECKVIIKDLCITTCWVGHWKRRYSLNGSAFSLNYHLFIISYSSWIFYKYEYIFFISKPTVWFCSLRINIKFVEESVSNNAASLGSTCDVTSGDDCTSFHKCNLHILANHTLRDNICCSWYFDLSSCWGWAATSYGADGTLNVIVVIAAPH